MLTSASALRCKKNPVAFAKKYCVLDSAVCFDMSYWLMIIAQFKMELVDIVWSTHIQESQGMDWMFNSSKYMWKPWYRSSSWPSNLQVVSHREAKILFMSAHSSPNPHTLISPSATTNNLIYYLNKNIIKVWWMASCIVYR